MNDPRKKSIGPVLIGFGLAIEVAAVALLGLYLKQGNPPIAVGLPLMVVGLALTMVGVTVYAGEKKRDAA